MIGDIYQVKDFQVTAAGVNLLNTYFYQGTGDGIAGDMGQAFVDAILPLVLETQPTDITHFKLEVASLFDPTDFAVSNPAADGVWAVGALTPFTALNYTLFIPTRAIKKGSKRIGTVPEDASLDGVVNNATYIDAVNDIVFILSQTINPIADVSKTFTPVVVQRVKEEIVQDPPLNPARFSYRLPVSFGEAVFANVTSVTVDLNVTSQVTRKL